MALKLAQRREASRLGNELRIKRLAIEADTQKREEELTVKASTYFFYTYGDSALGNVAITFEQLYQHFKARMKAEANNGD